MLAPDSRVASLNFRTANLSKLFEALRDHCQAWKGKSLSNDNLPNLPWDFHYNDKLDQRGGVIGVNKNGRNLATWPAASKLQTQKIEWFNI